MSDAAARGYTAAGEDEMLALGRRLAGSLRGGQIVTLTGDLGAGKTTLVRGMLRGLGFAGRVKSPSYGLVESYRVGALDIHHLDLYRLAEPGELDFIGLEELPGPDSIVLIEWPERAAGRLPAADRELHIDFCGAGRRVRVRAAAGTGPV